MERRDPLQVLIRSFSFKNPQGGTGQSTSAHNERFPGLLAQVKVTRGFYDYETGWRFVGVAHNCAKTIAYMDRNADDKKEIFFSQFELHVASDLQMILNALPDE